MKRLDPRVLLPLACALTGVILALAGFAPAGAVSPPTGPLQVPTSGGNPSAGAVPDAPCVTGAREPAFQGEVPLGDRQSGRSQLGYACNLSLVGQYRGTGASWVSPTYAHCAYMSTTFPGDLQGSENGVRVIDVADPAHPKLTAILTSPAMQTGTWESLKVAPHRGLLIGAASGPEGDGAGFLDVYDVAGDCAHPKLLNSLASTALELPANGLGHEGEFSPDERTYWTDGANAGDLTAVDVSNPSLPQILWTGLANLQNHGMSFSPDGNTLYLANIHGAGIDIFDVSQIQRRSLAPQVGFVGGLHWSDGSTTQASVPVSYRGVPYLIAWDELGDGGVRFIRVREAQYPSVVSRIRLAVNLPPASGQAGGDTANTGLFGYQSHYCSVDRRVDPTALACGWLQSGVRVFDIRDLAHPREIAYFNPPAQTGRNAQLPDSEHANGETPGADGGSTQLTADWCSSPPSFVGNQLWVTCQDNGFLALRFAPGVYPLTTNAATARRRAS